MEISQEAINEHRLIYPISFDDIKVYSSFEQILGRKAKDYEPQERMKRWFKVMDELKTINPDAYRLWATSEVSDETCFGCANRDETKNWCKWSELPCNYNPVIKDLGMACMGLGYEGQQKLFV